jgi:hypothetical protein
LINKTREIHQRFQGSAYYVLPTFEADVARYSTQRQEKDDNKTPTTNANFEDASCMQVIHQMGKTADRRYVPPELLKLSDPASLYDTNDDGLLSSSKKRPIDPLKEAENEERKSSKGGDDDAGAAVADAAAGGTTAPAAGTTNNNEDDDNFSDFQDADEDEEEDADYATNYYASEDESDGGGDEAVF